MKQNSALLKTSACPSYSCCIREPFDGRVFVPAMMVCIKVL